MVTSCPMDPFFLLLLYKIRHVSPLQGLHSPTSMYLGMYLGRNQDWPLYDLLLDQVPFPRHLL